MLRPDHGIPGLCRALAALVVVFSAPGCCCWCIQELTTGGAVTDEDAQRALRTESAIAVVEIERLNEDTWWLPIGYTECYFTPLMVLRDAPIGSSRAFTDFDYFAWYRVCSPLPQRLPFARGRRYLVICRGVKWPVVDRWQEVSGLDDPTVRRVRQLVGK